MHRCDSDRRSGPQLVVAAAALALALAACTVHGNPGPAQPDPASLDTGPYSVEPLTEPRNDSEEHGRMVESVRMAEVVVDPVEVDEALTEPLAIGAVPLPSPAKAAGFLSEPVRAVLERHGMLAGFAVSGSDSEHRARIGADRLLTVMVLRLPDREAAERSAQEIDAVDAAVSPDNVPADIPNHPTAYAHWRPDVPTLAATIAQESFVVTILAGHPTTDLAALTDLARAAFDAQLARISDFEPTPPDEIATLPLDRDGMIARLVPEAPGKWPYPRMVVFDSEQNAGWDSVVNATGIVFGPRGADLWLPDQDDSDIELLSLSGSSLDGLMRYPDRAAARRAFDNSVRKSSDDDGVRVVDPPAGVDDVRCWENRTVTEQSPARFFCKVLYGRHFAHVVSRTLPDVQQRAAAQYGLLVNSE